jgi:hypothetical protein
LLNQAVGMSHVDESREVLDLGFENGHYLEPAYPGNTFKKQFIVKKIRNTKDDKDAIVTFQCNLLNASKNDELTFCVDKTMIFRGMASPKQKTYNVITSVDSKMRHESEVERSLKHHAFSLTGGNTTALFAGELLLHGLSRPLGRSNSMSLSSLFGMTHPTIFNLARQGSDKDLIVPGALVASMALSAASREMHENLSMRLDSCGLYNKTAPIDTIGAMTYVENVQEIQGDLEEVSAVTVGVKNVDIPSLSLDMPVAVFESGLLPDKLEELVSGTPLERNIVVKCHYTFIRKAGDGMGMPLL